MYIVYIHAAFFSVTLLWSGIYMYSDNQARIITDGIAGYKAVMPMIPIRPVSMTTGSCDL